MNSVNKEESSNGDRGLPCETLNEVENSLDIIPNILTILLTLYVQ